MNKKLTIGIGCSGDKRNFIDQTLNSIISLLKKYRYTNKSIITIYNDDDHQCLDYLTALRFAEKYPNLIICKDNGQNLGIAKTYNKMCMQCETQYFMQFDSDDIINDFNIKQAVEFLQQNLEYCGSYGIKDGFDQNGKIIYRTGQQYDIAMYKITFNNNAMIFRVSDCKKIGFYFPQYLENIILGAALDVAMWIGMTLKKPMYFDKQVRTFGRQWSGGNHLEKNQLYQEEFKLIEQQLRKHYGLFNDSWTIYEKEIYYCLWNQYLNKQQKKQFFSRVNVFESPGIFRNYIDYLYKNKQYQKVLSNLFLAFYKNEKLKTVIASILPYFGLLQSNIKQFLYYQQKLNALQLPLNSQWFYKFFRKK